MSAPVQISEAASLAMHSVVFLASRPDRRVPTRQIAAALKASEAHLSKVLQRLGKGGLVRSARGPGGGFELAKPAEEIALLEVYEAVEGPLAAPACLFEEPICEGPECMLGDRLREANARLRERLAEKKVSELAHLFAAKAD
ncbi:MAG: RrF2 family transcriptional regulator [Planctomycetota bacterium]